MGGYILESKRQHRSLYCILHSFMFSLVEAIVGYPPVHYSALLRYVHVWSVTEESTVVADDGSRHGSAFCLCAIPIQLFKRRDIHILPA